MSIGKIKEIFYLGFNSHLSGLSYLLDSPEAKSIMQLSKDMIAQSWDDLIQIEEQVFKKEFTISTPPTT